MVNNCIIGFGGTGSKCLESFISLCVTGLGPQDVWCGIVDQDAANGNYERCQRLLENYTSCYDSIRRDDSSLGSSSLLATEFHTSAKPVWAPVDQPNQTFEALCRRDGMNETEELLFNALFSATDRGTGLREGFRGRPALGATVFRSAIQRRDPFWSDVYAALDSAAAQGPVRILLVASIFGGTGAAGFPTAARLLREHIVENGLQDNVLVGGILMLPYFAFRVPDKSADDEAFARSDAFLDNAKGALKYYASLLERYHLFDDLYLLGWDPLVEVPDFQVGGRQQINPPMYPELLAGLAATRFFAGGSRSQRDVSLIAQGDDEVTWADIPSARANNRFDAKKSLAQTMRFAFAYLNAYQESLQPSSWRTVRSQRWFRRLLKDVDLDAEATQAALQDLDKICRDLLLWAARLQAAAEPENPVKLIDANAFARTGAGTSEAVALLDPKRFDRARFATLINESRGKPLRWIFSNLCAVKPAGDRGGLGQFAGALHDLCGRLENSP